MNANYIQQEVLNPMIKSGIKQWWKLLFNVDIFCPSTGIRNSSSASRNKRIMSADIGAIGQFGASAILQGGEAVLGGASKILHMVGLDTATKVEKVNRTAGETAVSGAKAMGMGFVRGITGVVMDPIEMGKKKGALGVFMGIGKGLVGLVTKPVAGILDGGVGGFAALRKLVNKEDDDVIAPLRIARAFPEEKVSVLSQIEGGGSVEDAKYMRIVDGAQLVFQLSTDRRWNERLDFFCEDVASHNWFGIGPRHFFLMTRDLKLAKVMKLAEISGIGVSGPRIRFSGKSIGKGLEVIVVDEAMARRISGLMTMRANVLRYGE
jgi:hypothetical protein